MPSIRVYHCWPEKKNTKMWRETTRGNECKCFRKLIANTRCWLFLKYIVFTEYRLLNKQMQKHAVLFGTYGVQKIIICTGFGCLYPTIIRSVNYSEYREFIMYTVHDIVITLWRENRSRESSVLSYVLEIVSYWVNYPRPWDQAAAR